MDAGKHRDRHVGSCVGNDGGDARAYRQRPAGAGAGLAERAQADRDIGHVGDGVVGACLPGEGQAKLARAGFGHGPIVFCHGYFRRERR